MTFALQKKIGFLFFASLLAMPAMAEQSNRQQLTGTWQSDLMEIAIFRQNNQIQAKVSKVFPDNKGTILRYCTKGTCKGKKIKDLEIFKDFQWNAKKSRWEGKMLASGWDGKWYRTHLWTPSKNSMKTRSFVMLFYYTLDWKKI